MSAQGHGVFAALKVPQLQSSSESPIIHDIQPGHGVRKQVQSHGLSVGLHGLALLRAELFRRGHGLKDVRLMEVADAGGAAYPSHPDLPRLGGKVDDKQPRTLRCPDRQPLRLEGGAGCDREQLAVSQLTRVREDVVQREDSAGD